MNSVQRDDSILLDTEKSALIIAKLWGRRFREYNTVMKVEDGYVVTNKFDPNCNDKITPLTPGFRNRAGRSS